MASSVYDILQEFRGEGQLRQLLSQLDELAGRLENVRHADADSSSAGKSITPIDIVLPCPMEGHLPIFKHVSEFAALQTAAEAAAQQVPTHYSRDGWLRWAMSTTHAALVVDLAWHTIAATFQPTATMSAAVQTAVVQLLSEHYVGLLLDNSLPSKDLYCRLWLQTMAHATVLLLRQIFPGHKQQLSQQLQSHLQQQLRLWVTGLMPKDAAELAKTSVAAAAAAASPEGAAEPDTNILATTGRIAQQQQQRAVADMVMCKSGALVSSYLSQQQTQPHQAWQQRLAVAKHADGAFNSSSTLHGLGLSTASILNATVVDGAPSPFAAADAAPAGGDAALADTTSLKKQAAACMADADAAVQQYVRSKKAAAHGRRQVQAELRKQKQDMQQQLKDACLSMRARADCSNILSGWLDTSLYAVQPQVDALITDAKCKQQRQRSNLELRALDLAHRSACPVRHMDSLDAAAAAAALPATSRAAAGACARRSLQGGSGSPGRAAELAGGPSKAPLSSRGGGIGTSMQLRLAEQMAGCTLRSTGATASVRIMKAARPAVEAAKQQLGLMDA